MNNELQNIGRVSAVSVKKHTKKDWAQWVTILDEAGAHTWPHPEIVSWLVKKYKLTPWWRQIVTSGYEIHIGRRVEGQNLKGKFSVTGTKTLAVGASVVWNFLCSQPGQAIWLKPLSPVKIIVKSTFETEDGVFGEVRTLKPKQRLRLSWQETEWDFSTTLQVLVVPRNKNKCILVFTHENLQNARQRNEMRARWRQVLSELADAVKA